MGVRVETDTETIHQPFRLACVSCGADAKNLTLDACVIASFRVNNNGVIHYLKHPSSASEFIEQVKENGPDYVRIYCSNCGSYMGIVFDDESNIIGLNNTPPTF